MKTTQEMIAVMAAFHSACRWASPIVEIGIDE